MTNMSYLAHARCGSCDKTVYMKNPADIKIWYHPDDPNPLTEVVCSFCGEIIRARITPDHYMNLRKRGCMIRGYGDRFEPLTEEMIDNWDIDAELSIHF
jgi:hypothetical protein